MQIITLLVTDKNGVTCTHVTPKSSSSLVIVQAFPFLQANPSPVKFIVNVIPVKSNRTVYIIVGSSVASIFAIAVVVLVVYFRKQKKKQFDTMQMDDTV